MRVKGVDAFTIKRIAEQCGDFRLDNMRQEGRYICFVLRMAVPVKSGVTKFRKRGFSGKWTFAVCYHGHKQFMEQIFRHNPDAVIRTCKAAYKGVNDFKFKATSVGYTNAGSNWNPQPYNSQCEC